MFFFSQGAGLACFWFYVYGLLESFCLVGFPRMCGGVSFRTCIPISKGWIWGFKGLLVGSLQLCSLFLGVRKQGLKAKPKP